VTYHFCTSRSTGIYVWSVIVDAVSCVRRSDLDCRLYIGPSIMRHSCDTCCDLAHGIWHIKLRQSMTCYFRYSFMFFEMISAIVWRTLDLKRRLFSSILSVTFEAIATFFGWYNFRGRSINSVCCRQRASARSATCAYAYDDQAVIVFPGSR